MRTKERNNIYTLFKAKNLVCEICKEMFPMSFEYKGDIFQMIKFEKPPTDYIIFEYYDCERNKVAYSLKGVYILNMSNTGKITIGTVSYTHLTLPTICSV